MKFENVYKGTNENMRLALLSLWTPGSHPMRRAIEELLEREPLLAEPVFQSTFGWEKTEDDTWRNALNPTVIERLGIGQHHIPYKHQAESWKALGEGKSIVVTSGTGSGKTECFMYPVISDLFEQGNTNAIEAIFLYPLNALMEDQKKRLNNFCSATGLHFAVYNGDTPETRQNGRDETLSNEFSTREAIRGNLGNRPEILLTNPSMLEYILVRQKDQQMLEESAGRLRWIIIDEAHSYSGSAAVELAYQIKRILDAFKVNANDVRFACTSATIGGIEGSRSLADFISSITGQSAERIEVIGGNRIVPSIDSIRLENDLNANHLPSVERVLSLREQINRVAGMTLQQMWEWLCPNTPYDNRNLLPALHLLDQLCDMNQDGNLILSLRAHFFMRSIGGVYACANEHCEDANNAMPLYGRLTTYKGSVCPKCGAPLLELVQCKRCGSFVLMGDSNSQTHIISPCVEGVNRDDYFAIDSSLDYDVEDDLTTVGTPDTFYLLPYNRDCFFNPLNGAHFSTMNLVHTPNGSFMDVHAENDGQWVEVRNDEGQSYCPSCGRLTQGKRLNLKHFRIPINFINQTISPVLLHESAPQGSSWGKYIAFTDSRQGTAISAKTFNINVERIFGRGSLLRRLVNNTRPTVELGNIGLTEDQLKQIMERLQGNVAGLSLAQVSDCLYDENLFRHITGEDRNPDERAYKAALLRHIIGRKALYESGAENMGLIKLVYPGLNNIRRPSSLTDYLEKYGGSVSDLDWQDFLKISLDYYFRVGNHIQSLVENEKKYVRESGIGTPVTSSDDVREALPHWPTLKVDTNGNVETKQHRLVLLLCAGLGISTLGDLRARRRYVSDILNSAWKDLVDNRILTIVRPDDRTGYNHPIYHPNGEYIGCYYLDLSGKEENKICRIELAREVKECPVTGNLLDTTFCGFSPMMVGEINGKLFEKYRCSDEPIHMPIRPSDEDQVEAWAYNNVDIQNLKNKGLWSDRHNYAYKNPPPYIAAEHSAQQSKKLLRQYAALFSQRNPGINVLHCSTTMEMGVDIGDIDVVLMDTVPPTAANYLQRIGRAGRMGQSKAVAFSLCNNTPVGQHAFANPMWALQSINQMITVRPSQTIIQRHVNSFFFRRFICENANGISARMSIDEFMTSICNQFVLYLDDWRTDSDVERDFHHVFGNNVQYTVNVTKDMIQGVQHEYKTIIQELTDAFNQAANDARRQTAIRIQIRKLKTETLLSYLSEHQFIPNANMPIGVVSFDFTDRDQANALNGLFNRLEKLRERNTNETDTIVKGDLREQIGKVQKEIDDIKRATTASRDIHTALNEYAPEQTVVVNEKNYVSAGVMLLGAYNENTQTRGIYHCVHCGHTEYRTNLAVNQYCPVCHNPFHSIIDRDHGSYTLAYEPAGFRTDQNVDASREEKTEKQFYDIRPVLLDTNWDNYVEVNMCDITGSGESANILFYNVGRGHGFAFCKRCGRSAIEYSDLTTIESMPYAVRPGHNCLWVGGCDANDGDIARHAVFTGLHPTCYSVLKFKKNPGSNEYENDEQLCYSLGVVLKRALAKSEGIDENEIDFGVKQERDTWILFIYDTAKGGCGYSLKLTDPGQCQEVFNIARRDLEETMCNCHVEGGACSRCLVDRNNYKYAHLLSKSKVLDWLNRQRSGIVEVPHEVRETSPESLVVYQSLKELVKRSVKDLDVRKLTLCVSDRSDDVNTIDWASIRSEMGKHISNAIANGKEVALVVEYHPEFHTLLSDKLPFINLKDKFPDCDVRFVRDMGPLKTAIIVETAHRIRRYFTDQGDTLSFSNQWGEYCSHVFADSMAVSFIAQEEPTYAVTPSQIIREGFTRATMFRVENYYSRAIAPFVLKPQDKDLLSSILNNKHVNITFSDRFVNSALASLMLVYLIKELKDLYGFSIDNVMLQLDSSRRNCENERFNDWTYITFNFPNKDDADNYTDSLFLNVLGIDAEHSFEDAAHHRSLKIEAEGGGSVEIRFDHSVSGGYKSDSKYMNLDSLNGSVGVMRNDEEVLYYIIITTRQ